MIFAACQPERVRRSGVTKRESKGPRMYPPLRRFGEFYPGTLSNIAFRSPVLHNWRMRGKGFWRKFPEAAWRRTHPRDVSTRSQSRCSLGLAQHDKGEMDASPGHKGPGFHPEICGGVTGTCGRVGDTCGTQVVISGAIPEGVQQFRCLTSAI